MTAHSIALSSVTPAGQACPKQIEVHSYNSWSITVCMCSSSDQFGRKPKGSLLNPHRTWGQSHSWSLQR